MTIKELEAAGYKKYVDEAARFKRADAYFAKTQTDETGKRFQIVFYYYDWRRHEGSLNIESFQPEAQFRNDDFCVDVILHSSPEQTIKEVEDYFTKQWIFHGRPYYALFDTPRQFRSK